MSSAVWMNLVMAVPFIGAFIGIPLWMTLKRPEHAPDHSQARAYLAARQAAVPAMAAVRVVQPARQPVGRSDKLAA
jgi:hypothetical protein